MLSAELDRKSERLAKRFHHHYETLAPNFDYQTRKEPAVEWENIPENDRRLMLAVCREVLKEVDSGILEATQTVTAHEAIKTMLRAMAMQEGRETEEFHITQEVARQIWDNAKAQGRAAIGEQPLFRMSNNF